MKHNAVKASSTVPGAVIGVFQGECADSNITNKNGLDITREVWENVFNSDEYKEAIELGHYIGYLGHPDDPADQNFMNACIVMTEGHIDDNGKVYGTFNLVDTPVGQIVKKFIDAGVIFGISVRGAGDIISNSVDPETFVFRGFDLVTFPAYPEAIPVFSEVAASSDVDSQKKYQAICAAVKDNLDNLNTVAAVDVLQSCFAKQSDTYKELEAKKEELKASDELDAEDPAATEEIDTDDLETITAARVKGLSHLYIKACKRIKDLEKQLAATRLRLSSVKCNSDRKIRSMRRIMSSQLAEMDKSVSDIGSLHAQAIKANEQLKLKSSKQIQAIKAQSTKDAEEFSQQINSLKGQNLKYKHNIEAAQADIEEKDRIVANLQSKLSKTVQDAEDFKAQSSNLDAENRRLSTKIEATTALLKDYQTAYANLYARAAGVDLDRVSITATTSTSDLRRMIDKAVITASTDINSEYTPTDEFDYDVDEIDDGDDSLVTL